MNCLAKLRNSNMNKIKVFMLLIIFAMPAYAVESKQKTTAVVYSDVDKAIIVERKQPKFTIKLDSNPSTGFSWYLSGYNHDLITLIKHDYIPPKPKVAGEAGSELWIFKVNNTAFIGKHVTKLKLLYMRPWEINKASTAKVFTVVIG